VTRRKEPAPSIEIETETAEARRMREPEDPLWLVVSASSGILCLALPTKEALTLGRSRTVDVRVEDDSVSRHHATLRSAPDGGRTVEDEGSRNGTFVGGHRLEEGQRMVVSPGMLVQLGSATVLLMRAPRSPTTTAERSRAHVGRRLAGQEVVPLVLDPAMRRIYELLDVIAESPLSVLILGETGTGKEVFAAELHARSTRVGRPFLKLNCATFSGSLLESELFGYEKGAFTGAVGAKSGLFEAADGGTLFLDEIGEVPVDTQAKLLRVLDSGEVLRLGSVTPRKIDVRYVSATNRDLHASVADGRFRKDLLFRLNGFEVTLPPLRQRRAEVLALAGLFLERVRARPGDNRPALTLSSDARKAILAHEWPGNLRELKTTMERAATLAWHKGVAAIEVDHLMLPVPKEPPLGAEFTSLRQVLASDEKARVLDALRRAKGNQTAAAALLGVSRRTILTKIEAFGIDRPRKDSRRPPH
jgi:two-component system, NtrC family, response regulator AtoC